MYVIVLLVNIISITIVETAEYWQCGLTVLTNGHAGIVACGPREHRGLIARAICMLYVSFNVSTLIWYQYNKYMFHFVHHLHCYSCEW